MPPMPCPPECRCGKHIPNQKVKRYRPPQGRVATMRILKSGTDIHDGIVYAYRRRAGKRHRTMTYPQCIWRIERDGTVIAWASEVVFFGTDIAVHPGAEPAVSGRVSALPVEIPEAIHLPSSWLREMKAMPTALILTSDGEIWCPRRRYNSVNTPTMKEAPQ